MTSKEFNRRVSFYAQFLEAFDCFHSVPGKPYIWKITIMEVMAGTRVFYRLSPYITSSDAFFFDYDVDTLVIERYSSLCYKVDLRYFSSFVSKLTEFQYQVLESDSRFTNILNYLKNEQK